MLAKDALAGDSWDARSSRRGTIAIAGRAARCEYDDRSRRYPGGPIDGNALLASASNGNVMTGVALPVFLIWRRTYRFPNATARPRAVGQPCAKGGADPVDTGREQALEGCPLTWWTILWINPG